ncbi:ABC transporter ATP-binding protein [Halomarina oriensis]|uniref:ATP-binding cassette domain-containing protein n=1 Tax=Halomarina oriensis TaxID=671145 RepID=A0A6B0GHZ6_9EURY|nr:ABC transporter ATP-binding protein [Halomarina oriensis]MWG33421.1 ATP-binding cassette domain-containing protein [Halomarina oriensis]
MTDPLLAIDDLHVHFHTEEGTVEALDGVDLEVYGDEVVGVIGESGCGKTVTMLSVMGLLQSPPAEVVGGSIRYDGRDLLTCSESELNEIRGEEISMIYQDPMTSLNPVLTVGRQVSEVLLAHRDISKRDARERSVEMLDACGLADPERLMDEYPHSLSGGMRQRVMIAMALVTEPNLLIADEPTTALDVTIQAQVMEVLRELRSDHEVSIVFITHDLPLVSEIADRIAVMYAGTVAETCSVERLFDRPLHPYTRKLTESIPKLDQPATRLPSIDGTVPSLVDPPDGCRFASRCPQFIGEECRSVTPALTDVSGTGRHEVACHLYTDVSEASPPWPVDDEDRTAQQPTAETDDGGRR